MIDVEYGYFLSVDDWELKRKYQVTKINSRRLLATTLLAIAIENDKITTQINNQS
jgi:hypothetical protein